MDHLLAAMEGLPQAVPLDWVLVAMPWGARGAILDGAQFVSWALWPSLWRGEGGHRAVPTGLCC